MKIDELISELEQVKEEHGNLEVCTMSEVTGGFASLLKLKKQKGTIKSSRFDEIKKKTELIDLVF